MGILQVHRVKRARVSHTGLLPEEIIWKGDEYFWTKVNFRPAVKSKSRLRIEKYIKDHLNSKRGEHSSNIDDWNTRKDQLECEEDKEDLLQEINDFLDQKNESLDNIPYQLQENHIINEQIEELERLIEEVESIEI